MTKLVAVLEEIKDIDRLIDVGIDGFIFGIKGFSLFNAVELTMDELKNIIPKIKINKKKVFVSLNKIMYNEDIPIIKEYLLVLDKLPIDGVLFGDVSIVNLKQKMGLDLPLVWNQFHLVTSHYACNYWLKHDVQYAVVSNEITLNEIIEIKTNTKIKLMVQGYGYLPIFHSSRSLLTNYFKYINREKNKQIYNMFELISKKKHLICEDKQGTNIFNSHLLNALEEIPIMVKNDVEYIILNGTFINNDNFIKICQNFVKAINNVEFSDIIMELAKEVVSYSDALTNKGFLYKETIYKVKQNE
jgi:U32 family peptidase